MSAKHQPSEGEWWRGLISRVNARYPQSRQPEMRNNVHTATVLSFYSLLRRIPLQAFLEQALLFSFFHSELQICVLVPPSPRLWQKALEGTDRAEVYTCRTTAPVTTTTIGADLQSRTTLLGCRGLGAMDGILVPVHCRIE
jgi:hypothetical protein